MCNGGDPVQGFIFAENNSLCTEAAYPYVAPNGHPYPPPPKLTCNASRCTAPDAVGLAKGRVQSYVTVKHNNVSALLAAVAQQVRRGEKERRRIESMHGALLKS